MIKRTFENLLGIYRLNEWSNDDFILASKPTNDVFKKTIKFNTNASQGLTRYTNNDPEIIICRTRIGTFLPSLRFISLEDIPILRPDRIRKIAGYIIVAFLSLVPLVMFGTLFQYPIKQVPIIMIFYALFVALLFLIIWLVTKLELMLVTAGIRGFITKANN